jgi:hypothetical protein
MATKSEKKQEDWMNSKWRPAMGWMYMVVCVFDFIIFPIGFTIVQFWETQAANDAFRQWQPLTLVGAGLFHVAMGAVLGISAWSRGQEKIAGASGSGLPGAMAPGNSFGTMAPSYGVQTSTPPPPSPYGASGSMPPPPPPPPPKPVF